MSDESKTTNAMKDAWGTWVSQQPRRTVTVVEAGDETGADTERQVMLCRAWIPQDAALKAFDAGFDAGWDRGRDEGVAANARDTANAVERLEQERVKELERQLAALSEPPVWRDGPPSEPGLWWTQGASGVCYLRQWNQQMVDVWPKAEHRHAPAPSNLKPPVEPEPEPVPKPDQCDEFIRAHQTDYGSMVQLVAPRGLQGGHWVRPEVIRDLWPHIAAAIKGGAE